jgi:peroxiredoxin
MTDLTNDLDAFRAAWAARVGETIAGTVADDIASLRSSGILDRVARAGSPFPALVLPGADGAPVDLAALAARGPLVVTFYRGGWCPYCNLELRAWQRHLPDLGSLGATLVAVSPETPDHGLETAGKNDLAYPVLSDTDGRLADAVGIRFQLSETIVALYRRFGHDLPERNAGTDWTLPMPATFVVDRGGTILAAFADPDYRVRMEPDAALAVLRDRAARAA